MTEYRYKPLYRPAGYGTLPAGVRWEYVEAPSDICHLRPDLPVSSWRYGVIATDRRLTAEEVADFQLARV